MNTPQEESRRDGFLMKPQKIEYIDDFADPIIHIFLREGRQEGPIFTWF